MAITVTLQIFSGRPNPVVRLVDSDEKELLGALAALPVLVAPDGFRGPRIGGLGYWGFLISPEAGAAAAQAPARFTRPLSLFGGIAEDLVDGRIYDDASRRLEQQLLDLLRPNLEEGVAQYAISAAQTPYRNVQCAAGTAAAGSLPGRPLYQPAPWNTVGVLSANNCYNYANDKRFPSNMSAAVPGQSKNSPVPSGTCAALANAATNDGLRAITSLTTLRKGAWPVALFVHPTGDPHFYRQDRNGRWSHKPGAFRVRDCDEAGSPILNISSANALDYQFCGLFETTKKATIVGQ